MKRIKFMKNKNKNKINKENEHNINIRTKTSSTSIPISNFHLTSASIISCNYNHNCSNNIILF